MFLVGSVQLFFKNLYQALWIAHVSALIGACFLQYNRVLLIIIAFTLSQSFQHVEHFNVYDNKGYEIDQPVPREPMYAKVGKTSMTNRAPEPIPQQAEEINVEIKDDSPDPSPSPSPPPSPKVTPRMSDPSDEDYRIETEVM